MMVMISMENYYYSIVPVGGDHPRRTAQDRTGQETGADNKHNLFRSERAADFAYYYDP